MSDITNLYLIGASERSDLTYPLNPFFTIFACFCTNWFIGLICVVLQEGVLAFEYKCVAGPMIVAVKNAKARDQAVKAFEDIMNVEAADGWEYVGIDEFHISEPVGLLSRKRVFVPSKILVFKRLKTPSAVVGALRAQNTNHKSPDPAEAHHQAPVAISSTTDTVPAPEGAATDGEALQTSIKSIAAKVQRPKE
jgi:hypothetical protein